jgi:hypothetical protein
MKGRKKTKNASTGLTPEPCVLNRNLKATERSGLSMTAVNLNSQAFYRGMVVPETAPIFISSLRDNRPVLARGTRIQSSAYEGYSNFRRD